MIEQEIRSQERMAVADYLRGLASTYDDEDCAEARVLRKVGDDVEKDYHDEWRMTVEGMADAVKTWGQRASDAEAEVRRLRAVLATVSREAVFDEHFDVFAGWVRDVADCALVGAPVADAVGNADACAWAEEEVPDGWLDHVAARAKED